jgi:hydrogenase maturation protease
VGTEKKTLVLGLGNVIMGDEGVGVHAVRALAQQQLPPNVECLDGGTGGFILLEPLQQADRIILIDATADENPYGTVTRTTPKFATDYPPTLTAHDIGIKDLLDAFYIDPRQPISMDLSEQCERARDEAVQRILVELNG